MYVPTFLRALQRQHGCSLTSCGFQASIRALLYKKQTNKPTNLLILNCCEILGICWTEWEGCEAGWAPRLQGLLTPFTAAAEKRKVPGSQVRHFTDTWEEKWKWWILWCGGKPECWNKCPQMEWQELLTGSWTSCNSAEGTVLKSESGWWQWQFTKGCGMFAALETSETACLFFCERCSCSNRN